MKNLNEQVVKDFWEKAFLASLVNLNVQEARNKANEALKAFIKHWEDNGVEWECEQKTLFGGKGDFWNH